ncbi:hypothetical protein [Caulobacter segnis]|uniref:Permease n=2 Tax=Caulobacter segnis TaxID=88688 RepID=D5VDZ2_CAUST|nr:hypothetical protein [Caulobacter segnis]ADG08692.1 conserved hypothetical protein [Caulobacter segnis ATCC 21756]
MDFMKMLRSLEELLYEVMTWLVFYPRTFLLTLFQPLRTLEYSRAQFHRPEEEQFDQTLAPPLFLLLSLLLSHAIELGLHFDPFAASHGSLVRLSQQNLIIFRALVFAVFPLMFALRHLKVSGLKLSRSTLRGPFFVECYPAAVFAFLVGAGMTVANALPRARVEGLLLAGGATVWYLAVQAVWISQFDKRRWRGLVVALWQWLKAMAIILAMALVYAFGGLARA